MAEPGPSAALTAESLPGDLRVERALLTVYDKRGLVDFARALADLGVEVAPSQANFLWMKVEGISGADLAARLERERVLVAPGGPLGADDHVRAAVRGPNETSRLLLAVRRSLSGETVEEQGDGATVEEGVNDPGTQTEEGGDDE